MKETFYKGETMSDIVTVEYLLNILQRASSNGFGDAKIKCQDGYLHTDEISISPKEIDLRGYLFHHPPTKKVQEFKRDVEKAVDKFYGFIEKYSDEESDVK